MKQIIILLLITTAAQAQTPIQSYTQQPITIGPAQLGRDTLDGFVIGRFAEFQTLILNSRTKEVTLQVKCYVRSPNDRNVGIKPITVELKGTANGYNLVSTGEPIGGIGEVLNLYGIPDTTITETDTTYGYKKDAQGRYLTTVPVVDQWSAYTSMMDNAEIKLRNIIRQTMLKPGNMRTIIEALKSQLNN
jgi:hypothetical protein